MNFINIDFRILPQTACQRKANTLRFKNPDSCYVLKSSPIFVIFNNKSYQMLT